MGEYTEMGRQTNLPKVSTLYMVEQDWRQTSETPGLESGH